MNQTKFFYFHINHRNYCIKLSLNDFINYFINDFINDFINYFINYLINDFINYLNKCLNCLIIMLFIIYYNALKQINLNFILNYQE